ncbi:flagellar assembly protein FliH [Buchnera aphidicola str. Ak (Acyrthosiphon kondoi)]|uniref:Flagellar assembly protein FliH n=1 Tax=Buchnera aphidicola str. Ak (Acyrthosiphon kondoi) TaxID=1005090 RepID=G2LMF2_9GAMM|nr:FliH/SctL family protein [Buchnera aphidicola]AEO08440.1 flagellar assembly protein FliH [Buchnera aphidicola str. Ak (Acyrthosiphon kondoi)]
MPNSILEKKWTRWYPTKIFLKNTKKNKKVLFYSDRFIKEDFFIDLKNQKNYIIEKRELEIDLTKTKGYEAGFKKGLLQGKEEEVLLKNKLNSLFLNFENALSIFENAICSQLLKTVLKISSYVIGKNIEVDELVLINYIKKIINKDGIFLKKSQIIIHPNNKALIEDIFKDFFKSYKWVIVCDNSIDLNGCQIKSESVDINATIDARWQEICRLIYLEEY